MILQQLIDRPNRLHLLPQLAPPRLEHLTHRKIQHLLDKVVHPRSQRKDAAFPRLKLRVGRTTAPARGLEVFGPGFLEDSGEVDEAEEVAEDHLVVGDGLAGEDEGEGERDRVVEVEDVPACAFDETWENFSR